MSTIPSDVRDAEAATLKRLFQEKANMSQAEFAKKYRIGSAGMVWQYLNGRRPLNADVAAKFAKGLAVAIDDFSPRLASAVRAAARVVDLPSQAHHFVAEEDPPGYGKNFALDDVLRTFPQEERRRVLDDIAARLVRARSRFTNEDFHRALDLIDEIDKRDDQHGG
jgi:transcriptional regulator with XRE-family HTH domain